MWSGKLCLEMCSKSGKSSAEIGIQCRKLYLKMLPVRADCRWTSRIAHPSQLLQMIIFLVAESGKSIVSLVVESGKTKFIGCCFPPIFANSGTLTLSLITLGCSRRNVFTHHFISEFTIARMRPIDSRICTAYLVQVTTHQNRHRLTSSDIMRGTSLTLMPNIIRMISHVYLTVGYGIPHLVPEFMDTGLAGPAVTSSLTSDLTSAPPPCSSRCWWIWSLSRTVSPGRATTVCLRVLSRSAWPPGTSRAVWSSSTRRRQCPHSVYRSGRGYYS